MKQYFLGKGITIPFKHVTCVQCKDVETQSVYVSMMINTVTLYGEDSAQFLEEYHNWLDKA